MPDTLVTDEAHFVLDNDTELAGPVIDIVQEAVVQSNLFEESSTFQLGLALHEAISNAINHGNLEVSSDLRQAGGRVFEETIELRRNQEPYARRKVCIKFKISPEQGAQFTIRDEGPGFDVASVQDPTEEANLDRICGRGLLLIRGLMDEVWHNATGNEITMLKRAQKLVD